METLRLRVIIIGVGCFQLPSISIDMYLIEAVSTKTKSGKDQSQSLEAVTALHYFLESDGGNITALLITIIVVLCEYKKWWYITNVLSYYNNLISLANAL